MEFDATLNDSDSYGQRLSAFYQVRNSSLCEIANVTSNSLSLSAWLAGFFLAAIKLTSYWFRQKAGCSGFVWSWRDSYSALRSVVGHVLYCAFQPHVSQTFCRACDTWDNLYLVLVYTFQPPMTGSYVFSLACASACELWLSADDMEFNIIRMVKLEPWRSTEHQQWEKYVLLSVGANQVILGICSFLFGNRFCKEF